MGNKIRTENSWSRLEPKKTQVIPDRKEEHSNQKLSEMFLAPFTESTQPSFRKERQISTAHTQFGCPRSIHFPKYSFTFTLLGNPFSHLAQEPLGRERQAFFILGWISCNSLYQAENTVPKLLLGKKKKRFLCSKCFKLKSSK